MRLQHRLFTVDEFEKMIEAGVFGADERVELIEGEIVPMSPPIERHSAPIEDLNELLVVTFRSTHRIRPQLPLALGPRSRPEPDIALIPRVLPRSRDNAPGAADLVIEVSDSSLSLDRNIKASLYAKAKIPEYWILNVKSRRLEVRRDRAENAESAYGWDYSSIAILAPGQTVTPLFAPETLLDVFGLLGPECA